MGSFVLKTIHVSVETNDAYFVVTACSAVISVDTDASVFSLFIRPEDVAVSFHRNRRGPEETTLCRLRIDWHVDRSVTS